MVFWKFISFGIPYSCWSSLLHGWITISPADLICINKIFSNEFRDLFFFVSSLCFIFAEDITLLVHLYIYILLFLSVICVGNELFCTFHSCLRKRKNICMLLEISLTDIFMFLRCYLVVHSFHLTVLLWFLQEGFAFAHCTTCKAPYHLRVHVVADRKWRTLKFRFFVTRDIIFIFLAVQLVGRWSFMFICFVFSFLERLERFCFFSVVSIPRFFSLCAGNCFICIFGVLNRWFPAVLASTSMGFWQWN